jgi:hypothetical protein
VEDAVWERFHGTLIVDNIESAPGESAAGLRRGTVHRMTGVELRMSASVTLSIEHSHFTVTDEHHLGEFDAETKALDAALASPARVAAVDDVLVVLSPAADTYETPVAVEVWSARPPTDTGWDHEVELDLLVPSGRLAVGTATSYPDIVEGIEPAAYRLLVSGGRFDPWPAGSDTAQHFRLRLWPRPSPSPPFVVRSWPGWADYF